MLHPLDFSTRPKPRKGCLSDSERRDPGRKPENADTRDITAQWLDMGVQQPDGDAPTT
jgi:hypothetical protein